MPDKREGTVRTKVNPMALLDPATFPVYVGDGFALPKNFGASAKLDDLPDVDINVEIEVVGGDAIPVKVTVATDAGVSWEILSRIPVRDIVGTACLTELRRATRRKDGSFVWVLVGPKDVAASEEIREVVQALVGYNPNLERLKGVAS